MKWCLMGALTLLTGRQEQYLVHKNYCAAIHKSFLEETSVITQPNLCLAREPSVCVCPVRAPGL